MILSNVNIGTGPSVGDGDPLRTAFNTINNNFTKIQSNVNSLVTSVNRVAGRTGNVTLTTQDIIGINNYSTISYVDSKLSANIANIQANITLIQSDINTLYGNAGVQSSTLATLTSNAAAQAGSLTTLTANAASQAGELTTLLSNASVQAGEIASLLSNAGSQHEAISSLQSNAAVQAGAIADIKNGVATFGNLIPSANVTYSLGDSTHQWKDLFVSNNTIYIGGMPLSIDASGNLIVNGSVVRGNIVGITSINASVSTSAINDESGDFSYGSLSYDYAVNGVTAGGFTINYSAPLVHGNVDVNVGNVIASNITTTNGIFWANGVNILSTVTDLYANAAVQAGNIATIFANLGATSGSLATLTANAASQAGSLATITSVLTKSNVGIGASAGEIRQGTSAVAVGEGAGSLDQGNYAVAIGNDAGADNQGDRTVAVGTGAGRTNQGEYAVAIGRNAGHVNQGNNSIIINATTGVLNQTTANTFTVAPVRNDVSNVAQVMFYNTTSKEITYGNTINIAGNINANQFNFANGVNILSTVGNTYGNTQVATYLPTYSGNIAGNIVKNGYTWTFGTDGTTTFPGNLVMAGNTSVFGTNSALIQPADDLPLIALSSGANGAVSSIWVEDIGNIGTSNIAAVYANPTVGSKIVRIVVGQNGVGSGPNLWDFDTSGNLTLPSDGYLRITSGITTTGASPAPIISGFTITNSQGISGNGNVTAGNILANGTSGKIGYSSGNFAQQITSNSTQVTSHFTSGNIQLMSINLAAHDVHTVAFACNKLTTNDMLIVKHIAGGITSVYVDAYVASDGLAVIWMRDITGVGTGSFSPMLKYAIIRAPGS